MHAVKPAFRKPIPIIAVVFAIIGIIGFATSWIMGLKKAATHTTQIASDPSPESIHAKKQISKPLSELWQWEATNTDTNTNTSSAKAAGNKNRTPTGLSLTAVYKTIGKIQYQGDQLILDDQARQLLETSFRRLGKNVTREQIEELQTLLQEALPGTIGLQAAQLIGKYHAYQQAQLDESTTTKSVEENIELRERYLGVRLNARLYGTEQVFQRYLNAADQVKSDSALNQEQRTRQLSQLKQDLDRGVFNVADSRPQELQDVSNLSAENPELNTYLTTQALALSAARKSLDSSDADWQQRYQQYNEQRRWVIEAALTSEDKRKQLDQLYSELFTAEERSRIEDYIDADTLGSL